MKHCNFCDKTFSSDISYQIYCSSECRDMATKEKIAIRYLYSRRQKRIGKQRKCKSCKKDLSIYNDEQLCNECNVNPIDVKKVLKEIKGIVDGKE
jgi:predicted nucleic acid-binding Zn ribbon protein